MNRKVHDIPLISLVAIHPPVSRNRSRGPILADNALEDYEVRTWRCMRIQGLTKRYGFDSVTA